MKKKSLIILVILIALTLSSCNSDRNIYVGDDPSVALIIANRGDKAFNDAAIIGLTNAKNDFNVNITVLEHNNEKDKLEETFVEALKGNHQLIIGDGYLTSIFEKYVDQYPDKKFVLFDDQVDWTKGDFENLLCLVYDSNEASYLAGYIAASLNESGKIGFIGGIDRSINNNFLVGYIEGAQRKNPDIDVIYEYSNTYDDPEIGKSIAEDMIDQGVDVIFSAAGMTNHGVAEAADESDIFMIGVDTDQALLYEGEGEREIANNIVTSVTKNITHTIYDAIGSFSEFKFESGTQQVGLEEEGVDIATNKFYENIVDEETRNEVEEIKNEIISGDTKVTSTLGMTNEEIDKIIEGYLP